ncbi:MAG: O-methyltransferase [Ardenticatenales bacterium]|nr:O-methyltransferase [Ardenticatenales bacterium]
MTTEPTGPTGNAAAADVATPAAGSPPIKAYGAGDPALAAYVESVFAPEDGVLRAARERSAAAGLPLIHVGAMDARHLEVVTRAVGAVKAVEIGTLGGYSGIAIARGLAPGGHLWTLELEAERAELARANFAAAGVADRVTVVVGPALDNLPALAADGPFDLVFIDADKGGYGAYLDWAADHLRPGGVVLGDNAFAWGGVVGDEAPSDDAAAIKAFNARLAGDGRWRATMWPTAEGLAMGVRV